MCKTKNICNFSQDGDVKRRRKKSSGRGPDNTPAPSFRPISWGSKASHRKVAMEALFRGRIATLHPFEVLCVQEALPMRLVISLLAFCTLASFGFSQTNNSKYPTWWNKYQNLAKNGPTGSGAASKSLTVGANVDVSNECGPQSETYIAINSSHPRSLSGGFH